MRVRHVFLILALVACFTDAAAEGWFGTSTDSPPRVAALAATPVEREQPTTPSTLPFPTYAPTPHLAPPAPVLPAPPVTEAPAVTAPPTPAVPAPTVTTAAPAPAVVSAAAAPPPAIVARVTAPGLSVYVAEGDPRPAVRLPATTEWGNPRVLLTTHLRGDWIQVLLPLRPNNAVGWVRSKDVTLSTVDDAVDVDLGARTLTWSRGGVVMLQTMVAVGAPRTWTPTGNFFVTDIFPDDPRGAHGAWVLALNAHSDAMTVFEGGDPRIAIHGTNDPSSIGRASSNGCIRVAAEPLAQLAASLAPGTPVVVH